MPVRELSIGAIADAMPAVSSAYFLDADGTLLDIRPKPTDVAASAALISCLASLQVAAGGAVALVSGRKIADLDRIFAPLKFAAAGLHGAEIRFADGSELHAETAVMDDAREPVRTFVAQHPGLLMEDKGATIAVHFRQVPELESRVLTFLAILGAERGLEVQEGKMVGELKPGQFDKGIAVARLMTTPPFENRRPVFIGDDLTDEAGFAAVNARGGMAIRVGETARATHARFQLAAPSDVLNQLEVIAGKITNSNSAQSARFA